MAVFLPSVFSKIIIIIMDQSAAFQLLDNQLKFKTLEAGAKDGVELSEHEQEYLLPHFLMLLIGKPGSGKTTLLK
jgi:type II secretory ATPase GspE/PulE/Tfp pilus assembly ATPase PilB-like protein